MWFIHHEIRLYKNTKNKRKKHFTSKFTFHKHGYMSEPCPFLTGKKNEIEERTKNEAKNEGNIKNNLGVYVSPIYGTTEQTKS